MSKSITARKNARKGKGKRYKPERVKTYSQSRAPHCPNPPHDRKPCSMLVRRNTNDLVRVETSKWERVAGETSERLTVRYTFRDGTVIERAATMDYERNEREKVVVGMVDPAYARTAFLRFDEIRKRRWQLRQSLLAEMERQYLHGGIELARG